MNAIHAAVTFLAASFLAAVLAAYRLWLLLDPRRRKPQLKERRSTHESTHLLIVLGSGGHTAEMIAMLERAATEKDAHLRLDWQDFTHRTWVVSSGDAISAERAQQFEEAIPEGQRFGTYDIQIVPRAREIHQPVWTAPISSMRCLLVCINVLTQHAGTNPGSKGDFPDLILCNGPATATIMIFTSILLRFFDIRGCNSRAKMRTIYIESWARVKKLSLSGTLLSRVVDRFLVQWPQLAATGVRTEYIGVLV